MVAVTAAIGLGGCGTSNPPSSSSPSVKASAKWEHCVAVLSAALGGPTKPPFPRWLDQAVLRMCGVPPSNYNPPAQ
jgi:hypothetical protein